MALAHADRADWSIAAMIGPRDGMVMSAWTHEHFEPRDTGERAWTTQMVDFAAELLRGDVEIETTYRGGTPIAVRHYNRDAEGERHLLGHTGFLHPGRLLVWRPTRAETEQVSFM